jgi:uncharacterized protein (TIGR03435 family)
MTEAETIKEVIEFAYDIKSDNRLSGGPNWINSEKYDIEAKEEDSPVERLEKLPADQYIGPVRLMVQGLLADRFKLKVRCETKELPVYALVLAKNGPKLKQTAVNPTAADGANPSSPKEFRGIRMVGRGQLSDSPRESFKPDCVRTFRIGAVCTACGKNFKLPFHLVGKRDDARANRSQDAENLR